ncbi:MAG TPA: SgcJ/EcaC family oxidoreductase [Nitrospiraceae bacterium]|nr:SgcJ/EcaC family oxidoreductase [Nitrospiraceae bacterium]
MNNLLIALGLCAWLIAQSVAAETSTTGLSASDIHQIKELTQGEVRAWLARDWAAFAVQYADECILYPPNAPAIQGKAAIRAWIETFPPITGVTTTIVTMDGRGDLAYVVGTYTMTFIASSGEPPKKDIGKYVEIRRRQADGRWLLIVDIFNSDLPAMAPSK